MIIPYTDANKMAGSFIKKGNEVVSADDDVTLPPNVTILPSADVTFPLGSVIGIADSTHFRCTFLKKLDSFIG
ncbi:hypothetical protein H8B06_10470 [Sphingobacterium sp. DN00404]|uniref:Uncharacterized protein n=1 Tax=Sphingobacterium micropteri TaxID=2763501 RepID=A0ABR7YPM3_9SPHI|nr:hypothetical protein [Sphingobacterium micropteri]MBD1433252.1 hypothetical protein [Sphingobacterium micropteri]